MTSVHAEDLTAAPPVGRDDAAFERACERNWAGLIRYLRAISRADLDIEDAAGRVLEIAWRRRDDVRDGDPFTPWLLGIATNVARNAQRGSRRLDRLRTRLAFVRERGASAPSAHADLVRTDPGPATRALATLSESDRQVLALHAWEELSNDEIAQVLNISVAAAGQRLHRARTRLAAALESIDLEEPTS